MLNGIDPIIIFQISKNVDPTFIGPQNSQIGRIPIISQIPTLVDQPPIPIYLSESLTGLLIETESKSVDLRTEVDTLSNGTEADVNQKGVGSSVTVNIVCNKNSIGMQLFSAMIDLIFDKASSKEYAITYIHGATTIFRAKIESYLVNQSSDSDRMSITVVLSKGAKTPVKTSSVPQVEALSNTEVLA
jgi:hypothetical protein